MGTRLALVLVPAPSEPLIEVARQLLPLSRMAGQTAPVFIHLTVAACNGVPLLAAHVAGPAHPLPLCGAVATALSLRYSPALYQWYSDSVGDAGYAVFENGVQVNGNDAAIPNGDPMYPRFQEGFRRVFPSWAHLGPEELLDVIWAPEARYEAFVLSRHGLPLPSPEPHEPDLPTATGASAFSREFEWGRVPRTVLRGCAMLCGILLGLSVLGIAVWWLIETLR